MVPADTPSCSDQVTAVLAVPVTDAVNCCVAPAARVTLAGEREMTTVSVVGVPLPPQAERARQTRVASRRACAVVIEVPKELIRVSFLARNAGVGSGLGKNAG
jgi:hypothetical protein